MGSKFTKATKSDLADRWDSLAMPPKPRKSWKPKKPNQKAPIEFEPLKRLLSSPPTLMCLVQDCACHKPKPYRPTKAEVEAACDSWFGSGWRLGDDFMSPSEVREAVARWRKDMAKTLIAAAKARRKG